MIFDETSSKHSLYTKLHVLLTFQWYFIQMRLWFRFIRSSCIQRGSRVDSYPKMAASVAVGQLRLLRMRYDWSTSDPYGSVFGP